MSASLVGVPRPADLSTPPRRTEFRADDLLFFQKAVGGAVEVVELLEPAGSMYVNEDGLDRRLPVNARATLLAAAATPGRRGGLLLGDALVVGPADDDGWDSSVSEEYLAVLLEEPGRRFRVEFAVPAGGPRLRVAGREWTHVRAAYADGLLAAELFPGVAVRVLPV